MKPLKNILLVSMFVAISNAQASPLINPDLTDLTISAETYISTGANAIVHGNVQSGTYTSVGAGPTGAPDPTVAVIHGNVDSGTSTVIGASARVDGNVNSGGNLVYPADGFTSMGADASVGKDIKAKTYIGAGARVKVGGSTESGTYTTFGANSVIDGTVKHEGLLTPGAGTTINGVATTGTVPGTSGLTPPTLTSLQSSIVAQQAALEALTATKTYATATAAFGNVNTSWDAGVYNFDDILSFTAGTTINLDGNNDSSESWIFNIHNYMSLGADMTVALNDVSANSRIIWNILGNSTGAQPAAGPDLGYASIGAGTKFFGTILSTGYISFGADLAKASTIAGSTTQHCGGLHSAYSYVSIGATSIVGGKGCGDRPSQIPEPASVLLFGLGLFGLAGIARRKKV